MTDLAHEARLVLHEWARRPDPDPDQQRWKTLYLDAMIEAVSRTALLGNDELTQWRTATGHDCWPAPAADRSGVEAHLENLLAQLVPLKREPDPHAIAAGTRFSNALTTLHRSGAISDEDHADWHARSLRAQAPWLDDGDVQTIAGLSGAVAISVPPSTEEERLQDAAAEPWHEAQLDTALHRVLPCARSSVTTAPPSPPWPYEPNASTCTSIASETRKATSVCETIRVPSAPPWATCRPLLSPTT